MSILYKNARNVRFMLFRENSNVVNNLFVGSWLSDFYIDVSNNSDGSSAQQCDYDSTPFGAAETRVYTCPTGIYGRYVRIRFASNKYQHLQLCEVQVQGGGEFDLRVNL